MRITPSNSFKGRHYSGEVILLAMRWYLQYPLAYEHVAEMLAERSLAVDASSVWRWVQTYLYRAVDSTGQMIEFLLTAKRNAAAAKRFLVKAIEASGNGDATGHER